MMTHVQWVTLIGSLFFLLIVFEAIRRRKLHEAYALLWLASGVVMLFLAFNMNFLRTLSGWIGIEYAPATLFLLMIVALMLLSFQYSVVISKHSDKIRTLTQDIALLRQELEETRLELEKERRS